MSIDSEAVRPEKTEVFWMPGCSSCLRMKEFMARSGVAFEEVNLAAAPERGATLAALGLTVPAVVRGDRGVPGMDLGGIAALIGIDYSPPVILEPALLKARYAVINTALSRLITQTPVQGLDYKSPDRDRSVRALVAHTGTAVQEFLHATEVDVYRYGDDPALAARFARGRQLGVTGTREELIEFVRQVGQEFDTWWDELGYDDPLDRVVGSPWGYVTLHEVLERAVWHTAQHVRQLEYFLAERLGVTAVDPLGEDALAGLPLPQGIHT